MAINPNGPWRHGPRSCRRGSWDWSDADYFAAWKSRSTVNPTTGCWEWQGSRGHFMSGRTPIKKMGYALSSYRGSSARVHRKMLEFKLGRQLVNGEMACHSCDVPWCINPDHLSPGTQKRNFDEAKERGRNRRAAGTHCPHGHEFTPENTHWNVAKSRPGRKGSDYRNRVCKTCVKIRNRVKAGWPRDLAESMPIGQCGYRPPEVKSFEKPQSSNHD